MDTLKLLLTLAVIVAFLAPWDTKSWWRPRIITTIVLFAVYLVLKASVADITEDHERMSTMREDAYNTGYCHAVVENNAKSYANYEWCSGWDRNHTLVRVVK